MSTSFMGSLRGLFVKQAGISNTTPTNIGIDNGTWLSGRNAANTADVSMIRVNSSSETEVALGTGSWISTRLVTLTSAEVKALRATPKTLVAAPGVGYVLRFLGATPVLDYGGTNAFTESTANLAVKYKDGSGVAASQTIESTGFIDQTADTMTTAEPKIDVIAAKTACENQPLVLHNLGAGEIGGNAAGDNVMRLLVRYAVHPTGW